ncbi:MAG: shikimate kinase [Planctomycetota bacterium]
MTLQTHLYLTGYRGTGKTTVARRLARHFNVAIVDLDERIEQVAGKTILEIFESSGEAGFRDLETQALSDLSQTPSIVSLGGGAVLRAENREQIAKTGTCVWLDADAETIARRLDHDSTTTDRRPALTTLNDLDEIRHLLAERRATYQSVAQHRVETSGLSVEEVVQQIVAFVS